MISTDFKIWSTRVDPVVFHIHFLYVKTSLNWIASQNRKKLQKLPSGLQISFPDFV